MKKGRSTAANAAGFKAEIAEWAEKIRVQPRQIRLQKMRRKWASCSTRGTVSFNVEVLERPKSFRDYVIVHELLHLKVPNHGKLFKSLFRAYLPGCELAPGAFQGNEIVYAGNEMR